MLYLIPSWNLVVELMTAMMTVLCTSSLSQSSMGPRSRGIGGGSHPLSAKRIEAGADRDGIGLDDSTARLGAEALVTVPLFQRAAPLPNA